MGETTDRRSTTRPKARSADEIVRDERRASDERLRAERVSTDESLREERSTTDELLDPELDGRRVVEVVRESRTKAEKVLRDVRADSDVQLEKHADGLPEITRKLEHVAASLSKAAESLTGSTVRLEESNVDLVANITQIAEELKDTAESAQAPDRPPTHQDAPAAITEQLAEIAVGIAEVTSTLSEERKDADRSLREERDVTDRLIVQELKQVETKLGKELREERQALREDRRATDDNLANERRNTDAAVEHVQGMLAEERRGHAHAKRGVATRNEFLSIVSHDLRGPLMTMAGVAALMDQQAATDGTGQRTHDLADRVRRSVSVMERLINDLLDFSSFEDGQLRVAAQRLDIRPVILGAVDSFHDVALAKGLSLEADLPADPVMAKHDPHRILQVLSNLIHNAIKFTPEGGSIRIRVTRAGTFYQISVSDTGVGIPESELKAVFERFRQLNPMDHSGLGLGLYISEWIVEAHGGRIWAESQIGAGTTFHFTLPEERRAS
jgi:signal transduction histidine kinase